jgi:siderophore synthetase component
VPTWTRTTDDHHLKLPLSVLNTLVWRGLPTDRALLAPRVTAFLRGIRDADPFLAGECGLILLGEVASVAIPHRAYEGLPGAPYQFASCSAASGESR